MYLPPEDRPRTLRLIAWFYVLAGSARVAVSALTWFGGGPLSVSRMLGGAASAWAGWELARGRRDGLDTMLGIGTLALVVLAVAMPLGAIDPHPALVATAVILTLQSTYLYQCRKHLPWREEPDESDYEAGSYEDWITNPDWREHADAWFAHVETVLERDRLEPPDPRALVFELLDPGNDDGLTVARLEALASDRVRPALTAALEDPRFRADANALGAVVELLPEVVTRDVATRLVELLPLLEPDEPPSDGAYERIARSGDARFAEALQYAFAIDRAQDRVAAGLLAARRAGTLDDGLAAALREPLRDAVTDPTCAGSVGPLLVALGDRELPAELCATTDFADLAALHALVGIANDEPAAVPTGPSRALWHRAVAARAWLWLGELAAFVRIDDGELVDMLGAAQTALPTDDHDGAVDDDADAARVAYAKTLDALAVRDVDGLDALLRHAIGLDTDKVSPTAVGLLCERHGLGRDPRIPSDDGVARSHVQRLFLALDDANTLWKSGGFVHAVDSLTDREFGDLDEALETIAPPGIAALWRDAIAALAGDEPMPTTRDGRRARIAATYASADRTLEALQHRYYGIRHRLDVALKGYALQHRDEIRAALEVAPEPKSAT